MCPDQDEKQFSGSPEEPRRSSATPINSPLAQKRGGPANDWHGYGSEARYHALGGYMKHEG